MAPKLPLLDNRDFEVILSQLRDSASRHMPDWTPGSGNDAGVMLQHTFARLMEIVIERLNRVPEKHMLAFLHTMNISPLPPVPARAPLIFALKKDAPPTLVPRGTAVTAKVPGGASPVFETVEDITVLPASITCAYTLEPGRNRYSDYTGRLSGGTFAPFTGENIMPDAWFFITDSDLNIEQPAGTKLTLVIDKKTGDKQISDFFSNNPAIGMTEWYYSEADGDCAFKPDVPVLSKKYDKQAEFAVCGSDRKGLSPKPAGFLGGGCEPPPGRYIKCAVKNSPEAKAAAAEIIIKSAVLTMTGDQCAPKHLFFQNSRLDPEGYVLPFGSRPKTGDAFYIHIGDLPEQAGDIQVVVNINPDVEKKSDAGMVGNTLKWEGLDWSYSALDCWMPAQAEDVSITSNSAVSPACYTYSMTFKLKDTCQRKVGGENGTWLRATLPTGDCGTEAEYVPGSNGTYSLKPNTGKFVYPKVRSISVGLQYSSDCRVYRQKGHIYTKPGEQVPTADTHKELETTGFYLGFDRLFTYRPVSLYADTDPVTYNAWSSNDTPPAWEYLAADGWRHLYVNDETACFSRSGAVRFLTRPEAVCVKLFDNTERYWVRLSHNSDVRLNGIYLNAVPAEQAVTVAREALGTSNGSAGQRFTLRGTPVLTGQRVWIREDEAPTSAELIETTMEIRKNPVTLEQENWVLWHEQNSFGTSQPNSRHYTLDRPGGEIRFGDGVYGMVPLNGSAIAVEYRFGGGAHGNLPEKSISRLSTKLPDVKSVYNPIPATGGADSEAIPDVLNRGPMNLRHRGRGVTVQDIEWLVKEAAGAAIDRIKCLPGDDGQPFTLMLLPAKEGLRPLPDGVLSANIRSYLDRCLPASLSGKSFGIVGPRYVTTGISATIVITNPFESSIVRDRAVDCLQTFLHPRQGGLDGNGWEFGRNVYLSEICALLEAVEGVEHSLAGTVSIYPAAAQRELTLQTNDIRLETAYPAGSLLSLNGPDGAVTDQWLLAEPIVTDVLPRTIRVTGLREGDVLTITGTFVYSEESQAFKGQTLNFPAGSIVSLRNGFTAALDSDSQVNGRFVKDMLSRLCPEGLTEKATATILHPDTLTITNVRDTGDGGYEVTARRSSEDVKIFEGIVLKCVKSKVKAEIRQEYADYITYNGDFVTMRFGGFEKAGMPGGPLNVSLTLPDARADSVDFMITTAEVVTDTAYLFERELCTPGAIDVQIAE